MKKILLGITLIVGQFIYAQDFSTYDPSSLKNAGSADGVTLKHIAPAKMIIYEEGGHKISFYFDGAGKLKAVSSKLYSYDVATNGLDKKDGSPKGAPSPDFLAEIKGKLDKALSALKK